MKYEILGSNFPVVVCNLERGEAITNQGGAMAWMSPNIEMKTEGGGSLGKALGRAFSGESIFRNIYTAQEDNSMIAFSSSFPGSILPVEIKPNKPLILQKTAYLASTIGVNTEVFFNKKVMVGLFGGEGFIMQKATGDGIVFVEVAGAPMEYELKEGEEMILDTGALVYMDSTCSIDVKTVKGIKNVFFGGEGLFLTVVKGPGKFVAQTMQLPDLARRLQSYMTVSNK